MQPYLISLLIFIPLLAAFLGLFLPATSTTSFRTLALTANVLQVIVLVVMLSHFHPGGLQLVELKPWITLNMGSWGVLKASYFVGVDGLSLPLVALAVFVLLVATVSSWKITENVKGYFILLLILNGAIIGSFTALDFLLFYLFFEFMLLPMFFLIAIWGGPRREYASIKFFLYTLLGSVLILIVLIALYVSVQEPSGSAPLVHSFNLLHMADASNFIPHALLDPHHISKLGPLSFRAWAFLLLVIGFGIKLPMVPLHTWLPDAHVEAPTPISVILAALLLKIGGYGLARIAFPIFPEAAIDLGWFVGLLGVISIIYGGLNAMASKDLKRLIAYSSVSHMGFVLLGLSSLTAEGTAGAVYQMFSHGLISAMLFLLAGVLSDRTANRTIAHYSGLATKMPTYTAFVLIAFFASLGLPGFSGFIAEVMIFLGAFKSSSVGGPLHESLAIIATSGLVIGAAYYLWTMQRMFFGVFNLKGQMSPEQLPDLNRREYIMLVPLAVAVLVFGIFPQPVLSIIDPYAQHFAEFVLRSGKSITP
ncbi:complex I subunit 4 family protein [Chryseolinea lacunae]|uniref:NADH-quinone oxidoreductase subunit M n=1 Tax=Chryseolinea lacunae TaxID=2801331 RepID=A0ABS1KSV3_9BACT|nr:NADH-quinone oxidoreductase subunit M [Chryseolinea lacunae]MBL0742540.1 NADH-quinone oxidoreductase subunit M [Chryseolinea lacunae]